MAIYAIKATYNDGSIGMLVTDEDDNMRFAGDTYPIMRNEQLFEARDISSAEETAAECRMFTDSDSIESIEVIFA